MSDNELIALYIGFGTVIGSLIGAFISTFLGRSQKISTFRQEWINSIRSVFSDVLLQAELFTDATCEDTEKRYKEKVKLIEAISKTKLYLNLREEESKTLVELIEKITDERMAGEDEAKQFQEVRPQIEETMQNILKEEWNRVRDGEALWKFKKLFKFGGFFEELHCTRLATIVIFIISIVLFVKLVKCT